MDENSLIFFCRPSSARSENSLTQPLPATREGKLLTSELYQMHEEEEQQLWDSISQGDTDAYAKIHDLYYPVVFKCAVGLIKSKEIATQLWVESFAEVWLMREEFSGIELRHFCRTVIAKRQAKELREMLNVWSEKHDKNGLDFYTWAAARKLSDKNEKKWWVKWNIPFLYGRWRDFYDAG